MDRSFIPRWRLVVGGVCVLGLGGGFGAGLRSVWPVRLGGALAAATVAPAPAPRVVITARGRLQPTGGVIRVAGPSRPGAVVESLRTREGDWVEAGQVLAVLEGDAALRAAVQRLVAEARHASTELGRFERLYGGGFASAAERDSAQLQADVAQAELARARAELDENSVRAPLAGRVLSVHAHAGERIGDQGVLDIGDTAHMEAIAEVYETDIAAVQLGQPALVSAAALPASLTGYVQRIGLTIGKERVFDVNPAADIDARVVEVHIRLDDSARVAALTNLQVDVDLSTQGEES